jgi:hypothetical protein
MAGGLHLSIVILGLDPRIHRVADLKPDRWILGSSPRMTVFRFWFVGLEVKAGG